MRLLVLGGTRFLGRAVAASALAAGDEVICAARGPSEPWSGAGLPHGAVPGARFVGLDRSEPGAHDALVDAGPYDAVIDVTSRPSFLRAALAALRGHVAHWVYVSSISAYADQAATGLTPETGRPLPPAPPDVDETDMAQYGQCKVASENAVREAYPDALICRAGLIVGPEDGSDRFTYWPERIFAGGPIIAPGAPDDPVQWVDVRDLAAWLVKGARERLPGTYDGVGPAISRKHFLDGIAAALAADVSRPGGPANRPAPEFVWVDSAFLEAHDVNAWAGPRSLPLWLPMPDLAGMLAHDHRPALEAGLACRDLAETARDTLAWVRTGDDPARHRRAGLDRDSESDVLAAWLAAGDAD